MWRPPLERRHDIARSVIIDGNAQPATRQQALRALLVSPPADLAPVLHNLLGDRVVLTEALRGLANYDHPGTPDQILNHRGLYTPDARVEMINTLSRTAASCTAKLQEQVVFPTPPFPPTKIHFRLV